MGFGKAAREESKSENSNARSNAEKQRDKATHKSNAQKQRNFRRIGRLRCWAPERKVSADMHRKRGQRTYSGFQLPGCYTICLGFLHCLFGVSDALAVIGVGLLKEDVSEPQDERQHQKNLHWLSGCRAVTRFLLVFSFFGVFEFLSRKFELENECVPLVQQGMFWMNESVVDQANVPFSNECIVQMRDNKRVTITNGRRSVWKRSA